MADNTGGPGRGGLSGGENWNNSDDDNDDDGNDDKRIVAVVDNNSSNNQGSEASWEGTQDAFPESKTDLESARKWEEGERDENSDIIFCHLLGLYLAGDGNSGSGIGNVEGKDGNDRRGDSILSNNDGYNKEADGEFEGRSSCDSNKDFDDSSREDKKGGDDSASSSLVGSSLPE